MDPQNHAMNQIRYGEDTNLQEFYLADTMNSIKIKMTYVEQSFPEEMRANEFLNSLTEQEYQTWVSM